MILYICGCPDDRDPLIFFDGYCKLFVGFRASM